MALNFTWKDQPPYPCIGASQLHDKITPAFTRLNMALGRRDTAC